MKRTATIDVNENFEHVVDVTKAWETASGERMIRGVASGVLEDRDGERVSARAIAKMSAQPTVGGAIKLTSSHQQDWATEFGDVVKLQHDPEHDELVIDARLPAAGEDAIADKAWRAMTKDGKRLGFSIGGKLRKAYFELVDTAKGPDGRPKRRKVLDDIQLRHVALTEKPSYRGSFAEAVAKSFDGPEDPGALEVFDFTDDGELVAKAKPAPTEPVEDDEQGGDAPPAGTATTGPAGDPDAAAADPGAPDTAPADDPAAPEAADDDEPSDAEAAKDLPEAKRHLACPHCGHEFAADMPSDDRSQDPEPDPDPNDDAQARKSHQETDMDPMQETLEKIRALADEATDVVKTEDAPVVEADPDPEPEVAKSDQVEDLAEDDVLKLVAASHRHSEANIAKLAAETTEALGQITKAVTALAASVQAMPQGRRSQARVLPPNGEVEKSETETDDVAKRIEAAESPGEALKILNEQNYGIR